MYLLGKRFLLHYNRDPTPRVESSNAGRGRDAMSRAVAHERARWAPVQKFQKYAGGGRHVTPPPSATVDPSPPTPRPGGAEPEAPGVPGLSGLEVSELRRSRIVSKRVGSKWLLRTRGGVPRPT